MPTPLQKARPSRRLARLAPGLLPLLLLALVTCASSQERPSLPSESSSRADAGWRNEWTRGAVFYEVFVRSFFDSDGDGKGDLKGLIGKLDYLNDGDSATTNDLGVDALWLMPVFKSPSYHGYDTTDYTTINPDYGTNADFTRLCEEAHRRGMRVIVDLVMNHSGSGHPWFVESASSPDSPYRNWYVWRDGNPGWKQPWGGDGATWHEKNGAYYYGVFWGGMPDLNFQNPSVREAFKRIAALWLARGADGFRLDATRYLVEIGASGGQSDTGPTHEALREFAASVRRAKPEAALVAENWTDTPIIATYYGNATHIPGGDEIPMNFNFPLSDRILQAVSTGNAAPVPDKLAEMSRLYPEGAVDAPFLTNHDQTRLANRLGKNQSRMRNAAAILLTLPGAPFLYYGEEVGLENGPGNNDESKRTPMPWDSSTTAGFTTGSPWYPLAPDHETTNVAAQIDDPNSLLARYRTLIRVRKSSGALSKGGIEVLTPTIGSSQTLAFVRRDGEERVLVVHNLSDAFVTAGPFSVPASSFERVFADATVTNPSGGGAGWTVSLGPRGTGIFRAR